MAHRRMGDHARGITVPPRRDAKDPHIAAAPWVLHTLLFAERRHSLPTPVLHFSTGGAGTER